MKVTCSRCDHRYSIADDRVRGEKKVFKIRCRNCGNTITVRGLAEGPEPDRPVDVDWYVALGGEKRVLTTGRLLEAIREGDVTEHTFAWTPGLPDWVRASEILGAFSADNVDESAVRLKAGELFEVTLDDAAGAIAIYEGLLEGDPGNREALARLEALYFEQEEWSELVATYERLLDAAEYDDDRVQFLRNLAQVFEVALDEREKAADAWRRVLLLMPGDEVALRKYAELSRPKAVGAGASDSTAPPAPSERSAPVARKDAASSWPSLHAARPAAAPRVPDDSLDRVYREQMPYPIAILYKEMKATHRAGMRLGNLLRLTENVFRFLAYVNLADAVAQGVSEKKLQEWLRKLATPSMGKLLGLFRSATTYLVKAGGPLLHETAQLFPGDWDEAAGAITSVRNEIAHEEYAVPDREARPFLERLAGPLDELLGGLVFLRRYALGTFEGLRRCGPREVDYHWYASRGLEERCDPVRLVGRDGQAVWEDTMLLMDVRNTRVLHLEPYLHWGGTSIDPRPRVLWIQDIREGEARYRHPLARVERLGPVSNFEDRDGPPVSLEMYARLRAKWPGRQDLQLDEASRAALAETVPTAD